METIIPVILLVLVGVLIRIILRRRLNWSTRPPRQRNTAKLSTMIVLGSGGHTSEMLKFISTLDWKIFESATFVIADTDKDSEYKAQSFMSTVRNGPRYGFVRIPRTREVGQSYVTSVFTTLKSLLSCVKLMFSTRPDLVLANGPGTCVPICALGIFMKMFGIHDTVVVLSESYACVKHLSLTAKILHRLVDIFFVQWPALLKLSPVAIYSGRLPFSALQDMAAQAKNKGKAEKELGYVLVTVGSTKFDELIQAVDNRGFVEALVNLGFSGLHVQKGRGSYEPQELPTIQINGFEIRTFEFTPSWAQEIAGASLVIGHAGAGTILDSLEQSKAVIVVPNTTLMNNHQVDIAEELEKRGYVSISNSANLKSTLSKLNLHDLKPFPPQETSVYRSTIEKRLGFSE